MSATEYPQRVERWLYAIFALFVLGFLVLTIVLIVIPPR